jgi:GDP-D-mannose dehydratase
MSHVKCLFDSPEYVANVDGLGTLRIDEAVRFLAEEQECIKLLLLNCMEDWQRIKMQQGFMTKTLLSTLFSLWSG